jgi:hypothetical protein
MVSEVYPWSPGSIASGAVVKQNIMVWEMRYSRVAHLMAAGRRERDERERERRAKHKTSFGDTCPITSSN